MLTPDTKPFEKVTREEAEILLALIASVHPDLVDELVAKRMQILKLYVKPT